MDSPEIPDEVKAAVRRYLIESADLPAWAIDFLRESDRDDNLSSFSIRKNIFDESYLEFLKTQINLNARGDEWSKILSDRMDALSPWVSTIHLDVGISRMERRLWLCMDPETFEIFYRESSGPQ